MNADHMVQMPTRTFDVVIDDHQTTIDVNTWLSTMQVVSSTSSAVIDNVDGLYYKATAEIQPSQYISSDIHLPYPYVDTSKTACGLDFTDLGNGSILVNGTGDGHETVFNLGNSSTNIISLDPGTYILRGTRVSDGATGGLFVRLINLADTTDTYTAGAYDCWFTINTKTSYYADIFINMESVSVDNVTISPMLRPVIPIYGRAGTRLRSATKNLLHSPASQSVLVNGIEYEYMNDGSVHVAGSIIDSSGVSHRNYEYLSGYVFIPKGVPLILSGSTTNVTLQARYGFFGGGDTVFAKSSSGGNDSEIFTIPANADYSFVRMVLPRTASNIDETVYPMIRLASDQDNTWEQYSGDIVNVVFREGDGPETVYGGILDFKTGRLTVTGVSMIFNGTEKKYNEGKPKYKGWRRADANNNPNGTVFWYYLHDTTLKTYEGACEALCNSFNVVASGTNTAAANTCWYRADDGSRISFCWGAPNIGSTLDDWLAFLQQHNVQVWAPLNTPIVYQLDTHQMQQFKPGKNTIWSDAGPTTIIYYQPQN